MTIPTSVTFDHRRAIEIGAAGEHLVCADLLLAGYPAFLAGQGSKYDVALDLSGLLIRLTVKSAVGPRRRPDRPGAREDYIFSVGRSRRDNKGKTRKIAYSCEDVDLVALVALDTRKIAYIPIRECPSSLNLTSEHGAPTVNKFGPKNIVRRSFEHFPLSRAINLLQVQHGHITR